MHTYNPANEKIPKSVGLETGYQGFISHVGNLLSNVLRRIIVFHTAGGVLDKLVVILEMDTCVVGSAVNWSNVATIGTLPALLRRVACK
jgi:hypothetical protein